MINRLSELTATSTIYDSKDARDSNRRVLSEGPVPHNFCGGQYRIFECSEFILKSGTEYNFSKESFCLTTNGDLFKIKNILIKAGSTRPEFSGELFTDKSSCFSDPCDSALINVYKYNKVTHKTALISKSEITGKCQVIPDGDYYLAILLIHCD